MYTRDAGVLSVVEGLYTSEAVFFTEHFVIRGQVVSPERRLSDYLNSSLVSAEIRPKSVQRILTGGGVDLTRSHAHVTKAHLLFIIPVAEPDPVPGDAKGSLPITTVRRCWAALGQYTLTGRIQVEPNRDSRLILRSLERNQFIPFTDVLVTYPDRQTHEYSTIIVNRAHLEVLALEETT